MIRPAHTRRREDGFTLLEMVIVLVVLGIAMAAIFPAIGNMMRGSSRSTAVSQAGSEVSITARMIEEDVRNALGNRGTGERTDASFFPSVTDQVRIATIPALAQLTAAGAQHHDIVLAGPRDLHLNADVYPNPGIERVEWELVVSPSGAPDARCGDSDRTLNANWCLLRRVSSSTGAMLSFEVPLKGRGSYPTNTTTCAPPTANRNIGDGLPAENFPRVFCYLESVPAAGTNRGDNTVGVRAGNNVTYTSMWSATCHRRWLSQGQSPNTVRRDLDDTTFTTQHNRVDPTSRISRLDRITAVGATLLSGGGYGRSTERSYEHVHTAIRSRENEAYNEAIMCGRRAGWGR